MQTYHDAGARFLIVQGVHHDNFDNWNSAYQPCNAVKHRGRSRDLVVEGAEGVAGGGNALMACRSIMISWWWRAVGVRQRYHGDKAGVAYDAAHLGRWLTARTPGGRVDHPRPAVDRHQTASVQGRCQCASTGGRRGIFQDHQAYASPHAMAMRIMDVIDKYDPDFIYTDADTTQPFNGEKTGTGTKCDAVERVIADFYNRALANQGAVDKHELPYQVPHRHTRRGEHFEGNFPKGIKTDQVWIGENAVVTGSHAPNFTYSACALACRCWRWCRAMVLMR